MYASHTMIMNELLQSNIIYYIGCTWICHKSLIGPKPILILQVLQNKTTKKSPKMFTFFVKYDFNVVTLLL